MIHAFMTGKLLPVSFVARVLLNGWKKSAFFKKLFFVAEVLDKRPKRQDIVDFAVDYFVTQKKQGDV
jgi:hypothetical protein